MTVSAGGGDSRDGGHSGQRERPIGSERLSPQEVTLNHLAMHSGLCSLDERLWQSGSRQIISAIAEHRFRALYRGRKYEKLAATAAFRSPLRPIGSRGL